MRSAKAFVVGLALTALTPVSVVHAQSTAEGDQNQDGQNQVGQNQDGQNQGVFSDDIVVTAQKRNENLQSVGVAITAFSGEQMAALGMKGSADLVKLTPGVTFDGVAGGGYLNLPTVRGVGQNDVASGHHEQPNAVYIDDVYISSPIFLSFSLFDMERAEVLRGPQGTLFGRNATGGLFQFVPARPSDELGGSIGGEYGSYNTVRLDGVLTGPLAPGVRARISGLYHRHDGYWKNLAPGQPDAFGQDFAGGRAQIEFDLGPDITNRVSASYGRNFRVPYGTYEVRPADVNAQGYGFNLDRLTTQFGLPGCTVVCTFGPPGDPLTDVRDPNTDPYKAAFIPGFLKKEVSMFSNHFNAKLGSVDLASITSYLDGSFSYKEDCDGTIVQYCEYPASQSLEQFTQELRLSGGGDSLKWVAGAYYYWRNADNFTNFSFPGFGISLENTFNIKSRSVALFGQADYELTPELKLIVGARYTWDKLHFNSVTVNPDTQFCGVVLCYDFTDGNPAVNGLNRRSDNDWSGKIQLNYQPTPNLLVYAGASKGTKGGGYNASADGQLSFANTPYRPERIYAYEGGVKATIVPGVRFNVSGFYYDYKNYQAFDFISFSAFVSNKDATFYGGEAELYASFGDGFDANLGLALLESNVKGIASPVGVVGNREAPKAPKFSISGLLRKSWSLGDGKFAVQADARHVSKHFSSVSNSPGSFVPASTVANARLSYTSDAGWEVAGFVNNVFDKAVQVYNLDFADPGNLGYNLTSYGLPRWWGVQLSYRFGSEQ